MDKKLPLNRKLSRAKSDSNQEQISSFKKQNVIFKIHSGGKNQQNWTGLPAKFSINICNEPVQITNGLYNRQFPSNQTSPAFSSPNKNQFQNMKTQRMQPVFNFQQYDKQLKDLIEDKKKWQNLVQQLQQACRQYQIQNQNLISSQNLKDSKINELEHIINELKRQLKQANFRISQKQAQCRQNMQRAKIYQLQFKKNKQLNKSRDSDHLSQLERLQTRINQLEQVIGQKEIAIKKLSNFNNQICNKVLDQHMYYSSSCVKQMQKWLKMIKKKYQNNYQQQKKPYSQAQNNYIPQLIQKSQDMSFKITELQKIVNNLDFQLRKSLKQRDSLAIINQDLKKLIHHLQTSLQHTYMQKQTQQSFFRKTLSSTINNQEGAVFYDGTVKVKMDALLVEKDKRIDMLQTQILDAKSQNTLLRSKIFQIDCQQDLANQSYRIREQSMLKKSRSMQNFYMSNNHTSNRCNQSVPKENNKLFKLISQCSNLSQTLGNFMSSYQTQIPYLQQEQKKSRYSHQHPKTVSNHVHESNKQNFIVDKRRIIKEQKGSKLLFDHIEPKYTHTRYESYTQKIKRNNDSKYPLRNDPITQRIHKTDRNYTDIQKCRRSCCFDQMA